MDESKKTPVPEALNESVVIIGGSSRQQVTVTRISAHELRWFYNNSPQDVRLLTELNDTYWVGPLAADKSVKCGWMGWDSFVEYV